MKKTPPQPLPYEERGLKRRLLAPLSLQGRGWGGVFFTSSQSYDPFGSSWLSPLVAGLPILLLLGLLATGRVSAPRAALIGLAAALLTAILVHVPVQEGRGYGARVLAWTPAMLAAAANGAAFGLLPIGWIVLAAIFLYNLTVETGQFEIVEHSVAALSDDRRLQALLIAFCFGAFVEGAAGFGTPGRHLGSLQTITASQLVERQVLPLLETQAQLLLASANSTGGVMGKMIDAQSIVVAAVATGQHDQEGPILRFVFGHSLVLALLMGLLVLLQAYVVPWMIP